MSIRSARTPRACPSRSTSGETIALFDARLPVDEVMAPASDMTRNILFVAALIAALAMATSIFIGHYWISAVEGLTDAAERLGSGDLAASIPVGGGKELTLLGTTMERMRRNLVELTADLRRSELEAKAVLGGIVEGVYSVDEDRRIGFVNPQAERLLKISADEAIGRFCGDVLKPAARRSRPPAVRALVPDHRGAPRRLGPCARAGRAFFRRQPAPRRHRERAAGGRRHAGSSAARRDGARGRSPHARHRAREHLARVPHAAGGAARVDRAAAATASAR